MGEFLETVQHLHLQHFVAFESPEQSEEYGVPT